MAEFASKGVAGAGLGLGIAGTALALFNNGLFGGGNAVNPNYIDINRPEIEVLRAARGGHGGGYVNHYELNLVREIAAKDAVIVDKDAKLFTAQETAKVYADLTAFKLECERRFAYDEKLIADNKCAIERTNQELECSYYKMAKVIRPWDICPPVWPPVTPTAPTATDAAAKATTAKASA